jgi:predicted dehydrogenase
MAEKFRVAVIGRTGKGNYGHGLDTVWLNHPRAEIVAVADENEAGRAAAVKRLKAPASYADFTKMLKAEKPRIVSVADRFVDLHRDMVIACAEHGAHIFLEKPIARTLQEADEMVAACEKHHVKCALAHQTRYAPRVKQVKALLDAGKIGDVLEIRGYGKCDHRGGGEDLVVLGTHTFDLMRYFVGEPRWCSARIQVQGKKALPADVVQLGEGIGAGLGDTIFASYGFDGSILGQFVTYRANTRKDPAPSTKYALEIRGTKGQIHLGFGAIPLAFLCEDPYWMPARTNATWQAISSDGLGKPEPHKAADVGNGNRWIVDDLIEAIEKDRPPLDSIADGRAALEMILAVYESHRHEKPVDLPLKNRKHPLAGW